MQPFETLWAFEATDTYHGGRRRGLLDSFRFQEYMAGVAQTDDVCVVATPLRTPKEVIERQSDLFRFMISEYEKVLAEHGELYPGWYRGEAANAG